jgi:LPS O-antigen subunit length determinant protein (WzzB/FepE family)
MNAISSSETVAAAVSNPPHAGTWVFVPIAYADELRVADIRHEFWRARWLIAALFLASLAVGVILSLMLPRKYEATAILSSVTASQGGFGSLVGRLGGLASLAGLSGASQPVDRTNIVLTMLKSQAFLTEFAKRRQIVVPLLAAEGWDKVRAEWRINGDRYNTRAQTWMLDGAPVPEPTDGQIAFRMRQLISIEQSQETGLITLGLESYSPEAARTWLNWIIHDVNEALRAQDVREASASLAYLQKQLEQNSTTEMRQVLYQLIEDRTSTAMLASVSEDYALKIVDPPSLPEAPSFPRPLILVSLAAVAGALLGIGIVLARIAFARGLRNPQA